MVVGLYIHIYTCIRIYMCIYIYTVIIHVHMYTRTYVVLTLVFSVNGRLIIRNFMCQAGFYAAPAHSKTDEGWVPDSTPGGTSPSMALSPPACATDAEAPTIRRVPRPPEHENTQRTKGSWSAPRTMKNPKTKPSCFGSLSRLCFRTGKRGGLHTRRQAISSSGPGL